MSSLRMRSLIYLLSMELYGKAIALPEFPIDRQLAGLGMSDWDGYAKTLAARFNYTNTFLHSEPRLDITNVPPESLGRYDFLISSDVFEHIPIAGLDVAFRNSRELLRSGGTFLLTVPYTKEGETREHFPNLYQFRVSREGPEPRLLNTTREGKQETFGNLVFHGGEGETLEMRVFSERDVVRRLLNAGFTSVQIRAEHVRSYGIVWPIDHSLPIVAKA